jgi:hypothetical protein
MRERSSNALTVPQSPNKSWAHRRGSDAPTRCGFGELARFARHASGAGEGLAADADRRRARALWGAQEHRTAPPLRVAFSSLPPELRQDWHPAVKQPSKKTSRQERFCEQECVYSNIPSFARSRLSARFSCTKHKKHSVYASIAGSDLPLDTCRSSRNQASQLNVMISSLSSCRMVVAELCSVEGGCVQ